MKPVTWIEVTEERYDEMLGVLPPALMIGDGFLVGEPSDHRMCEVTGNNYTPTWAAFVHIGPAVAGTWRGPQTKFYESDRALTKAEFRKANRP